MVLYKFTREFIEFLADRLQIKSRRPDYGVWVYKKDGDEEYDITPVTFGPEHLSIEMDRRWNMSVDELSLTISNINGEFSPDYSSKKKFTEVTELAPSGFHGVLVPFNRLKVNLGYIGNTVQSFVGQIQDVDIDDNNSRITVVAKNELRKLLKPIDPLDTRSLIYENKRAFEIVEDLCKRAGITKLLFEVDEIKEYDYAVDKAEFEIGMFYKDAVDSILETMGHRIYADRFGAIHVVKIELYTQTDVQHWEFDDYIDLTQGRYRIEANIIRNRIIVQSKDDWKAYEDPFLMRYTNGEVIAMAVEAPWANTEEKKRLVANNYFMQMRRKLRRVTVATIGNPTMDVGDLVSLKMLTSTATAKYMIMGIKTAFTDSGYIDVIDLEFVTKDIDVAKEAEGKYSKPVVPKPPEPEQPAPAVPAPTIVNKPVGITSQRQEIINLAHKYLGMLYQWGGDKIASGRGFGVDCSHFTYGVLKQLGLMSGYRVAHGQKQWCTQVAKPSIGDLVFYSNSSGRATHVGFYIGNGKVMSASGGGSKTTTAAIARRQNAKIKIHNTHYDRRTVTYGTPPTYKKGAPASNASAGGRKLTVEATAYTADPKENGGYTTTAIGTKPRWGIIAVDPKVIPLRTKVRITYPDGTALGTFVAEDTGGAIKGNKIDILYPTKREALNFGRRSMIVYID